MKSENEGLNYKKYNGLLAVFIVAVFITLTILLITINLPGLSGHQVTKVYYADNITRAHQIAINLFNQKYCGKIEIVPIDLPFIKFNTNLRKELLIRTLRNRNTLIDVFAIDQVWNARFIKWALPLEPYFSDAELTALIPKALASAYAENTLTSIPLHIDVSLMFYRKDLIRTMDETGHLEATLKNSITWDEFIRLGQKYHYPSGYFAFPAYNYEGLIVNFMEMLGPHASAGLFDLDSLAIDPQTAFEGTRFIQDLIEKYRLVSPEVTTFNEERCYEYALMHDVPFFTGWPSFYKTLEGTPIQDQIGIAAIPHAMNQAPSSMLGGWSLMISKHSHAKKEAALFIKFMISPEVQKILLREGGFLPVAAEIYSDPDVLREMNNITYLKQLVDDGFHRPNIPQYTQLSKLLADNIHAVLVHKMTAPEAFQKPIIIPRY